jgi:hypothetical protein
MKFAVLAALVAIALPAPAFASDWVFVDESVASKDRYYIDRQSIRLMPNGYKRAWVRNDYNKPSEFGDTSSKLYYEYDCNQGRSRTLHANFYKGEEVTNSVNPVGANAEWTYLSPDSIADYLLKFVCRR